MLQKLKNLFEELYPKHDFAWREYGNRIMGLCPFHKETKQSFNIYEFDGQVFYKCFACGESGSINTILRKLGKDVQIDDTQIKLAEFINACNVELILDTEIVNAQQLLANKTGRSNTKLHDFFKVGFLSPNLINNLPEGGKLIDSKIRLDNKVGWFVFPYYSLTGHIVSIKFRDLTNSSRFSRVFKTGKQQRGYFGGLGFLKQFIKNPDGWIYPCFITEGETDAMAVFNESGLPALSVGGVSGFPVLLQQKISEYGFIPIILPDFDDMSLLDMGAGRKAILKLYEEQKRKKNKEKIFVLVSQDSYKGKKDICDAITKELLTMREVMQYGSIKELLEAVKEFKRQWEDYKLSIYNKKAKDIKEKLPAIQDVYLSYLGISDKEVYDMSSDLIMQEKITEQPPILSRFPSHKISVIASFGGTGKTTFSILTALEIARFEKLKVCIWSTEHDIKSIKRKLEYIFLHPDYFEYEKEQIYFRFGMPKTFYNAKNKTIRTEGIKQLEELLYIYDVVFLDPLLSFLGTDENDNQMVRNVFDAIHFLLSKEKFQDKKKAIIFLHHFNKHAIKDSFITDKDITEHESGKITVNTETVAKLINSVRGASAVVDGARYVESIVKTDTGRFCLTIKTNENTRNAGEGEKIPEINFNDIKEDDGISL